MWNHLAELNPELDSALYIDSKDNVQENIEIKTHEFTTFWMENNLSLYFDTAQHLVISYANWREECEKSGHVLKEGRIYSNIGSDSWLKNCKNLFYSTLGMVTTYFTDEGGFLVENTDNYF